MPEPQKPSLVNQPTLSASEKTREALSNISSKPEPERVETQPLRTVTNIYGYGSQGKF
jgi:hypothetical protein